MNARRVELKANSSLPGEQQVDTSKYHKYYSTRAATKVAPAGAPGSAKSIDIEQEIARKQQLENENTAQDIKLKRTTLQLLFGFLAVETALIFIFAFCQAVGQPNGFHLEDWSFRILVSATIAQITGMLFVAVRYLFPKK